MRSALACVLCAGCSFIAVHGPRSVTSGKDVSCTDSDVLPSIDAVVGTLGVAGALGGELADHLSSHPIHHYELIIGLPVLVAGIVYLVAASHGTHKVETCRAVKQGNAHGCDGCPTQIP